MTIRIYPRFGQEDALQRLIAELGHGLVLHADTGASKGRAWICQCTDEQAKQIEAMNECSIIARSEG